jgi:uncharacterized protein (TIGR00661 family)
MKKKFIFLVQGEGRGHMTQAIVLHNILKKNGHEISCAFIGSSKRREVPAYFLEQMTCEVRPLPSPNFVLDKDNKSLRLFASVFMNMKYLRTYFRSLKAIDEVVRKQKPDILVNFYDLLGGFYFLWYKPSTRHVVIGHQFLASHPDFPFAASRPLEKWMFQSNNAMVALRAVRKIALSFSRYQPDSSGNTVVVPPLMRQDITGMKPEDQGFILAYMVNDGYGEQIMEWHRMNRSVKVHGFWDRKGAPEQQVVHENLVFHKIDYHKFAEMLRQCHGYVSTAGFESICEAMYLGKPILMMPVESQYEQACNAIDAERSGAGISAREYDISKLLAFIPEYKPVVGAFSEWVAEGEKRLIEVFRDI